MAPVRAWGACGVCLIHATRPRCTMTLARDPIPIRLDRWIHSFEVATALSPQALSLLSPGLRPPEPYLAPTDTINGFRRAQASIAVDRLVPFSRGPAAPCRPNRLKNRPLSPPTPSARDDGHHPYISNNHACKYKHG